MRNSSSTHTRFTEFTTKLLKESAAVPETIIAVSQHIGQFKYDPAKCSFKTWLLLLTRQRIAKQFAKRDRAGQAIDLSGAGKMPVLLWTLV